MCIIELRMHKCAALLPSLTCISQRGIDYTSRVTVQETMIPPRLPGSHPFESSTAVTAPSPLLGCIAAPPKSRKLPFSSPCPGPNVTRALSLSSLTYH